MVGMKISCTTCGNVFTAPVLVSISPIKYTEKPNQPPEIRILTVLSLEWLPQGHNCKENTMANVLVCAPCNQDALVQSNSFLSEEQLHSK